MTSISKSIEITKNQTEEDLTEENSATALLVTSEAQEIRQAEAETELTMTPCETPPRGGIPKHIKNTTQ